MLHRLPATTLVALLTLAACDDGGGVETRAADAFVAPHTDGAFGRSDVAARADLGAPDAAAPADARPDADAVTRDAAPVTDAAPPVDAAPPDAAPDAALPEAFDPAAWQRGSIYLLMVDRFADGAPNPGPDDDCFDPDDPRLFHGGDLVGLRQRLDYLAELGVDTVWVTPLTAQIGKHGDQCGYHGYWTALRVPDDGALEPRLGTEQDLHDLLDALHARGMRLMLDMVVNHPGYGAPITGSHPEWFHPREGCERLGDPEETCPLAGLPDFDHDVPAVQRYLADVSVEWATRFAIDAIRMDTVKHVPLDYFADTWIPAVRAARPSLYLLGELFDESPYDSQRPFLDAGFDGLFDFRLRRALIDAARGDDPGPVAERVLEAWLTLGPERARLRSTFIENHDVPRFATEIASGDGDLDGARFHLALVAWLTTPGIPQLYAGTELGMAGTWPDNRRDMPDWAFAGDRAGARPGFVGDPGANFDLTRDLLRLRRDLPALHAGDYVELWRPGGTGVPLYVFARRVGDSRVIVAIHAGAEALDDQAVPVRDNPFLGEAEQALLDGEVDLVEVLGRAPSGAGRIEDGALILSLPPRSAAVWTLSPTERP